MTFDPIIAHHVDTHVLRDAGVSAQLGELAAGEALRFARDARPPGPRSGWWRRRTVGATRRTATRRVRRGVGLARPVA